ncbi:MAG: hypothetical protein KDA24_15155 [Deltaproteobacteria bacterium]|nr:hypothetical protein [Deltaproteobacteria bacterium]
MSFSAWRTALEDLRNGRVDELRFLPERSRLWRIADRLDAFRLHHLEDGPLLSLDDLVGSQEDRAGRLFLGMYSEAGLVYAFQKYGLWERIERVARNTPVLTIQGTGESRQTFSITDGVDGPELCECRAGLRYGPDGDDEVEQDLPGPEHEPWLSMDWLKLQNPYRRFQPERPRLPGQDHPGLGIGREAMELMLISGWRLGCMGVVAFPAWFHNAVMYRIHYRFVNPEEEGRFLAMVDAWRAAEVSLAQASFDMDAGRVIDADGQAVEWRPGPLVAPLDERADLEHSKEWLARVEQARAAARYVFPTS